MRLSIMTGTFFLLLSASLFANSLQFQPDGGKTLVDLRASRSFFDACPDGRNSAGGQCFYITVDPPPEDYIQEATLNVTIRPAEPGRVLAENEIGEFVELTFVNGYTGNGRWERVPEPNAVTFKVPVVNVSPPTQEADQIDIFEMVIGKNAPGNYIVEVGAEPDVIVRNRDGTETSNTETVFDREVLRDNVLLDIHQEVVPPIIPDGVPEPSGSAFVRIDANTGEMFVSGQASDLTSPITGVHVHGVAGFGENAGVVIPLTEFFGTFEGSGTIPPDLLDQFLSGRAYINVHTELNPAGEIRGQIPEPSSQVLFLIAMLSVIARIRKR